MPPRARRTQLSIFLAAYLLYDAARWIFASDPDSASVHAEWVIDLERSVHVGRLAGRVEVPRRTRRPHLQGA
jgi:hypothetical protein